LILLPVAITCHIATKYLHDTTEGGNVILSALKSPKVVYFRIYGLKREGVGGELFKRGF